MKRWFKGFIMSISMFSILPVPKGIWEEKATNLLIPFYPWVGLLIGGIWYGLSVVCSFTSIPIMVKAVILMLVPVVLSGFLHMDGYMDTMDAIGSRRSLEEKRAILKDSHVGAFAVIYFGIWLLLSFAAMYSLLVEGKETTAFLWIPLLSRAITGFFVLTKKPISDKGYLSLYRKDAKKIHIFSLLPSVGIAFLIPLLCGDYSTGIVLFVLLLSAFLIEKQVTHQFEGISGDLSGCILTMSELIALLTIALL